MRKTLLLTIAMICLVQLSNAQFIEKNKKIMGGSLGLGFSSTNDSTGATGNVLKAHNFYVSLYPSYGKAIRSNLVLGYYLSLGFNNSRNEDVQNHRVNKSNSYQLGGNVFLEKFFSLSNRLAFSGRLSAGMSYSSGRSNDYLNAVLNRSNITRNFTSGISLVPILNYKLNQKFLLGLSANDFASVNFIKGTTESSGPNMSTIKTTHTQTFLQERWSITVRAYQM